VHAREVPGTDVRAAVSMDRGQFVPALRIETQPPAVGTIATHIWHSRTGQIVAYGGHDAVGCWMTWPRLATYRFSLDHHDIAAHPDFQASAEIVWDTYRRSVLPMAMQARGWEALHASGVSCSHGMVAFCAVSETGKSSVAYGLARRGFAQWADDAVVLSGDAVPSSVPLPFQVRLRASADSLFEGSLPRPQLVTRNDRGDQVHRHAAHVHAICVLERHAGATMPLVERMEGGDAFRALLTHAHEFNPHDAVRRGLMLQRYLGIAATVPVFRIAFDPVHGPFSDFLDTLVREVALEPASESVLA
jgi:hypothetical protein